jgi:glucokinase
MQGRLQGLEGLNWTDFLQAPHSVPVLNDAHAALLGEAWKGAAVGYRDAVLLTLGTGVGGAILADGRLYKGHIGRAGHLGHICLNPDGPPDIVGTPGSLEQMIGNCTLPARSGGRFTLTRQLVDAHLAGDAQATEIWLRSIFNLAAGITSIINAIDPEVIILGGGIAQAGPALFDPLKHFMERLSGDRRDRRCKSFRLRSAIWPARSAQRTTRCIGVTEAQHKPAQTRFRRREF